MPGARSPAGSRPRPGPPPQRSDMACREFHNSYNSYVKYDCQHGSKQNPPAVAKPPRSSHGSAFRTRRTVVPASLRARESSMGLKRLARPLALQKAERFGVFWRARRRRAEGQTARSSRREPPLTTPARAPLTRLGRFRLSAHGHSGQGRQRWGLGFARCAAVPQRENPLSRPGLAHGMLSPESSAGRVLAIPNALPQFGRRLP